MAILTLAELKAALHPKQCVLGIDLGSTTIGMAISDPSMIIASPLETLKRGKFRDDSAKMKALISERNVGGIVLGLPISMDGTEGPRCQSTRDFAANVLKVIDLPIAFWDERLSTAAVQRVLIKEADMTRKRRAQVVDKMAAAYILQGALDARGQ
jgi:putative holliday junction resolvase